MHKPGTAEAEAEAARLADIEGARAAAEVQQRELEGRRGELLAARDSAQVRCACCCAACCSGNRRRRAHADALIP